MPASQGGFAAQSHGGGVASANIPAGNKLFTNIQGYLAGNQPATEQLAQNISQNLGQQTQAAQNAITGAETGFGNQVTAGTPTYNQQAIKTPSSQVPADLAAALSGQYTGPTDISTAYTPAEQAVSKAQSAGSLLQSPEGTVQYLQQQNLVPGITQGGKTLDTLLLQGNPAAQQKLSTAAQATQPLTKQLSTSEATSSAKIPAAQTAQTKTQSSLGQGIQNFRDQINQLVQSKQNALNMQQQQIQNALKGTGTNVSQFGNVQEGTAPSTGPNLNADQLQALGVTQEQWNQLMASRQPYSYQTQVPIEYTGNAPVTVAGPQIRPTYQTVTKQTPLNVPGLESYYTPTATSAVGIQNVVTPEQIAYYQALTKLANQPEAASWLQGTPQAMPGVGSFNVQQAISDAQAAKQAADAKHQADVQNQQTLNAIQNMPQPSDNKTTIYTTTGASIGSYFGPEGAVIGAAVGWIASKIF